MGSVNESSSNTPDYSDEPMVPNGIVRSPAAHTTDPHEAAFESWLSRQPWSEARKDCRLYFDGTVRAAWYAGMAAKDTHSESARIDPEAMRKFLAEIEEPRLGIHEDGTEEMKSWDDLWSNLQEAAKWIRSLAGNTQSARGEHEPVTDLMATLKAKLAEHNDKDERFMQWWTSASFDTMAPETVARRAWDAAQSASAANPGAYRWISEAAEALKISYSTGKLKDAPELVAIIDGLLSGVPCPPEDLGFNSPADQYARDWKALNERRYVNDISKEKTMVCNIKVNGEGFTHLGEQISYADVLKLAGYAPDLAISVTYRAPRNGDEQRSGSMRMDQTVRVEPGMSFTAVATGSA